MTKHAHSLSRCVSSASSMTRLQSRSSEGSVEKPAAAAPFAVTVMAERSTVRPSSCFKVGGRIFPSKLIRKRKEGRQAASCV